MDKRISKETTAYVYHKEEEDEEDKVTDPPKNRYPCNILPTIIPQEKQ
jgi:hypothetical protein